MPPASASQLPNLYDILIATRDGTTLPCQGRQTVYNLAQVAYMQSTLKPSTEATEIQRKDQLTQLSSAQVIDRDFDAWPQVDQGDWSDGMGQRVFSGQGEAAGTVSNKSTKYWDGQGILWPITDYLPKRGVLANPDQAEGGTAMVDVTGIGTVSGTMFMAPAGKALTFAYVYQQTTGAKNNILVIQGDGVQRTVTNPPGTVAGGSGFFVDMIVANGVILWLAQPAGTVTLSSIDGSNPPVVTTQLTIAGAANNGVGTLAAGQIGNKTYVAFIWMGAASTNLRVIDTSGGSWTASATDVPLPLQAPPIGTNIIPLWVQLEFLGDDIILAGTDYAGSFLMQFNVPSQTWTTLAKFPNSNNLFFCPIAGGLFVLSAYNARTNNGMPDLVDAWIVQGGAAQHVGPIDIQSQSLGATGGSYITGQGQPVGFGPYAVFPITFFRNATTRSYVAVLAYDVLRGRLFKMNELGPYSANFQGDRRMATMVPTQNHSFGAGILPAQWGVAVPALGPNGDAQDTTNVQRLLMNVTRTGLTFSPILQQGVEIVSSLIDFSNSQNKLYRQVIASFTPLPSDAAITVQLDVWLDQDPANLAGSPDFTTGAVGNGVGGGVTGQNQLKLVLNKVARKLVYRVVTTGPSTTQTAAVKLTSVATQVATGWSLHYFLVIGRGVLANNGRDYAYPAQDLDDLAAHVFLKQLWRLRGGECKVTLPDGQSYNALLQLLSSEGLKSLSPNQLSDQPYSHEVTVELKVREDV